MKRYYFYLLLLIHLICSTSKAETYTTPDGYKFEASLIPDKHSIMLNEPLYFSLEIKNLSNTKIAFSDGGDYRNEFGRPDSFNIYIIDGMGQITPKVPIRFSMGGIIAPRQILPNEKQTIRFLTPQWIKFEKTDTYKIICEKNIIISKYEDFSKFQLFNAPTVPVKVSFHITVKPNNDDEMNKIIDSFGNDMLGKVYVKRSEAFKAMHFINDKRIIKYFVEAAEKDFANEREFSEFRYYIFQTLGKFDDKTAFQTIIKNINSPNDETRRNVSIALSGSPYYKAEKYLLSMQNDKSDSIRLDVVHYLGKKKTGKSTAILKKMIKDGSNFVSGEAKRYLKERGEMIN